MIKNANPWFSFKGVKNTDMGLLLESSPVRFHAGERGEALVVAGRDGCLWQSENALESYTIRIQLVSNDACDLDAVYAWLTGSGWLVFSDEPERAYKAQIRRTFTRNNKLARFTNQEFMVTWDVQPYRYLFPEVDAISIPSNGTTISNPGTAASRPRITIAGSGDVVLYIGAQQIEIEGMESGAIIDCELQDVFNAEGTLLINSQVVCDEFPTLASGANVITWDGNITSMTIEPRWRYI